MQRGGDHLPPPLTPPRGVQTKGPARDAQRLVQVYRTPFDQACDTEEEDAGRSTFSETQRFQDAAGKPGDPTPASGRIPLHFLCLCVRKFLPARPRTLHIEFPKKSPPPKDAQDDRVRPCRIAVRSSQVGGHAASRVIDSSKSITSLVTSSGVNNRSRLPVLTTSAGLISSPSRTRMSDPMASTSFTETG